MNINFDRLRKKLANQFNQLAHTQLNEEQIKIMDEMRKTLVVLLCMYETENPKDSSKAHDLSESVHVDEIKH